ncbi:Myb/SANT-like DNA-binding domain [Popillia japonica]|uniref:Myb/SANT-like DNA-binding domain n=1 Tax=Popillia japonica TaxID=7064 RepID=A0AAW1K018_POPJA
MDNLSQQNGSIEEEPGDGENITVAGSDKFTWDRKAALLLLDEYHQKKKTRWKKIAQTMVQAGYQVDGDMLDRKIRNTLTFNKIKDNNQKKRTGRGAIHWKYYDKMCYILTADS